MVEIPYIAWLGITAIVVALAWLLGPWALLISGVVLLAADFVLTNFFTPPKDRIAGWNAP